MLLHLKLWLFCTQYEIQKWGGTFAAPNQAGTIQLQPHPTVDLLRFCWNSHCSCEEIFYFITLILCILSRYLLTICNKLFLGKLVMFSFQTLFFNDCSHVTHETSWSSYRKCNSILKLFIYQTLICNSNLGSKVCCLHLNSSTLFIVVLVAEGTSWSRVHPFDIMTHVFICKGHTQEPCSWDFSNENKNNKIFKKFTLLCWATLITHGAYVTSELQIISSQ